MADIPGIVVLALVLVLAVPAARVVLQRRGEEEMAADLRGLLWPLRAFTLAVVAVALFVDDSDRDGVPAVGWVARLAVLVAIAAAAWIVVRALEVAEHAIFRRLRIDVADNQRASSRRTQLQLVRRVATVFVWCTAVVVALLTFRTVRDLGPALVAYAGVIGVVLGLALRDPLQNLVSGLIVATSEPVRIDDVVVIRGEWGRVSDIGLTKIVVTLWDQRTLVVPTSWLLSEPFENWTHDGAELIGTVVLEVDHGVELDEMRAELERCVQASQRWDERVCLLQVVDARQWSVQVRVLVSAADPGVLWDLRCDVREQMVAWMAARPPSVPRLRTGAAGSAGAPSVDPGADGGGGRKGDDGAAAGPGGAGEGAPDPGVGDR